MLRMIELT
jgi:hypothetical protein